MEDTIRALRELNPWWGDGDLPKELDHAYERMLFEPFRNLAVNMRPWRTPVLVGQRGAGKTGMMRRLLGKLLRDRLLSRGSVCYVDFEEPSLVGKSLIQVVDAYKSVSDGERGPKMMFLDEVLFLKDWTRELKFLTDLDKGTMKYVATGSKSPAINPGSDETGYGRLHYFHVPPLLFHEFLEGAGRWPESLPKKAAELRDHRLPEEEISQLNRDFIDYVNHGSIAESRESGKSVAAQQRKSVKSVHTAIFRDIPSMFHVAKPESLYKLYLHIAKNVGRELSKKSLANHSGLSENTVGKYMDFFKFSFSVRAIKQSNHELKSMKIESGLKYVLENPSHRSALTGAVDSDDPNIGFIVEAATFSQTPPKWYNDLGYLRFMRNGKRYEIGMVHYDDFTNKVTRMCEVKWNDNPKSHRLAANDLRYFNRKTNHIAQDELYCTTKCTYPDYQDRSRVGVRFLPTAQYCLFLGLDSYLPSLSELKEIETVPLYGDGS